MTITNETILKAAKAAGLDVETRNNLIFANQRLFVPHISDTDNAKIMDGANISLYYDTLNKSISTVITPPHGGDIDLYCELSFVSNKAQARREAVILCAAAKWDAMQGEKA